MQIFGFPSYIYRERKYHSFSTSYLKYTNFAKNAKIISAQTIELDSFWFVFFYSDRKSSKDKTTATLLIALKYDEYMKIDYFSVDFMRSICFTASYKLLHQFLLHMKVGLRLPTVIMDFIYCMRIKLLLLPMLIIQLILFYVRLVPLALTHNKCTHNRQQQKN